MPEKVDPSRIFDSGQAAVEAGLQPMQMFFVPNSHVRCGYETRRVAVEPGQHNTRGEYGTPVWSETACYKDEEGSPHISSFGDGVDEWMIWDVDFGWL
jgi:hypothetical protein